MEGVLQPPPVAAGHLTGEPSGEFGPATVVRRVCKTAQAGILAWANDSQESLSGCLCK